MFLQLLNGLIGWHEETKAKNAMEALQANMASDVEVFREVNGEKKAVSVKTREVVCGDVINLPLGAKVPCDVILIKSDKNKPLKVNLSTINGEVDPRSFSKKDMIQCGGIVEANFGLGLAVKIGPDSTLGEALNAMKELEAKRPTATYQKLVRNVTL